MLCSGSEPKDFTEQLAVPSLAGAGPLVSYEWLVQRMYMQRMSASGQASGSSVEGGSVLRQ